MKNKLYIISAIIVCLSIVLSACDNKRKEPETTAPESVTVSQTEAFDTQTQTVTYVDSSGYHVVSRVDPPTQERTHPPVPSHKNDLSYKVETIPRTETETKLPPTLPQINKPTQPQNTAAADNPAINPTEYETVPEKSSGLTIQFKTAVVNRGNDATIAVNGEANKEYIIEVYRNSNDKLAINPESKTANSSGVVSWTFETDNLNQGYRKIIIKEKNSDKFIQTSIFVN